MGKGNPTFVGAAGALMPRRTEPPLRRPMPGFADRILDPEPRYRVRPKMLPSQSVGTAAGQ